MVTVLAVGALLALLAAYLYGATLFDDPTVPVVADLFPLDAAPPYTVLEIWAHPDDETSMGGTTAQYGRHPQVRVVACYFTAGEAGTPGTPPQCSQEELGKVRRAELAVAAAAARMEAHEVADVGDGQMADHNFEALEEQAVRWIRTYRPTLVCTWDPSGASGHPDHIRTEEVVRAAFHSAADPARFPDQLGEAALAVHQARRLYEMVVPARLVERYRRRAFRGNTEALDRRSRPTHALDVRGLVTARTAIARAHRTQRQGLTPFAAWYGPFVYFCWQKEYFRLAMSAEPTASR